MCNNPTPQNYMFWEWLLWNTTNSRYIGAKEQGWLQHNLSSTNLLNSPILTPAAFLLSMLAPRVIKNFSVFRLHFAAGECRAWQKNKNIVPRVSLSDWHTLLTDWSVILMVVMDWGSETKTSWVASKVSEYKGWPIFFKQVKIDSLVYQCPWCSLHCVHLNWFSISKTLTYYKIRLNQVHATNCHCSAKYVLGGQLLDF